MDNANPGTYNVGGVNYLAMGLDNDAFIYMDNGVKRGYGVAYAAKGNVAMYQIWGHIQNKGGGYEAVIKGSYRKEGLTDSESLVKAVSGTLPVVDEQNLGMTGLY